MPRNPFTLTVIPDDAPFCNRSTELKQLTASALAGTNVVLFSPRRFGKTSLVKRVQAGLAKKGVLTLYADFFGVRSVDDVAGRIAKSVYAFIYHHESLMKKALRLFTAIRPVLQPTPDGSVNLSVEIATPSIQGIDLLDKTLSDLGKFIEASKPKQLHIAFDEFQEITELKDRQIEGILRAHIQFHRASYFFVGSRRHLLLNIFNARSRPFYQSAQLFELKKLPFDELVSYLVALFHQGGKRCPVKHAEEMARLSRQYPYYAQKLALHVFDISGKVVYEKDVTAALDMMITHEAYFYQATIQALSPRQIGLLTALAKEPTTSILSSRYMSRHGLGSIGGVQAALKKLNALDLVEKDPAGRYTLADPIFSTWLRQS